MAILLRKYQKQGESDGFVSETSWPPVPQINTLMASDIRVGKYYIQLLGTEAAVILREETQFSSVGEFPSDSSVSVIIGLNLCEKQDSLIFYLRARIVWYLIGLLSSVYFCFSA